MSLYKNAISVLLIRDKKININSMREVDNWLNFCSNLLYKMFPFNYMKINTDWFADNLNISISEKKNSLLYNFPQTVKSLFQSKNVNQETKEVKELYKDWRNKINGLLYIDILNIYSDRFISFSHQSFYEFFYARKLYQELIDYSSTLLLVQDLIG